MSQAIQKRPMEVMREIIMSRKDQIAMALPKHLTIERIIRVALTAIAGNYRLMECSPTSVLGCVIQAAQLGLEVNTPLGHAYLVPYRIKGKYQCQLQIGYRGMIDLARRSGQMVSTSAHIVYENDKFEYEYGLDEKLVHKPNLSDRGNPIASYAVAKLHGGGYQFEVLGIEQIEKARSHSMTKRDDSPWNTHWDEMARKTAIRRLFKYLPVSVEVQRAVGLDELAESGVDQKLEHLVIDVEPESVEDVDDGKTGLDRVIEKAKAQTKQEEEQPPEREPGDETEETPPFDVFTVMNEKGEEIFGKRVWPKKRAEYAEQMGIGAKMSEQDASALLDRLIEEQP